MKRRSKSRGEPAPSSGEPPRAAKAGSRISPAEVACVCLLLALGVGVRLWAPERMAVEHFDEGVYASNLWFDAEAGYQYPNRPLYAPPLLPALIEWSSIFLGPRPIVPMLPSLAAGCATLLLVWWTARQWFGPAAGLASLAAAATSGIHILYSRAALTDVLLCFWWLAAVALTERAYRQSRFMLALAAGAAAGLAWCTKYNGWLTVGIAWGGATGWLACGRLEVAQRRRLLLIAMTIAVTAVVVWSPVWIGLQSFPGGYGAVAENHAKYVVGLGGWWSSAVQQIVTLRALDGWSSAAGLAIAALTPTVLLIRRPGNPMPDADRQTSNLTSAILSQMILAAVVLATSLWLGAIVVLGLLAWVGVAWRLVASFRTGQAGPETPDQPAVWLLLVWLLGLTFATPLYYPYPRLALPWLVAAWLGAGAAFDSAARWLAVRNPQRAHAAGAFRLATVARAALLLAAMAAIGVRLRSPQSAGSAWQPHQGLPIVAGSLLEDLTSPSLAGSPIEQSGALPVVFVYAEPALLHHLNAAQYGRREPGAIVLPAANLDFAAVPSQERVYLAAGLHAQRSTSFVQQLEESGGRLHPLQVYRYRVSDLVLSDHFPPSQWPAQRIQAVTIYRIQ